MQRMLFGTGTARGGTGILVQTLGSHSAIEFALDAFLALFKSFRNAAVDLRLQRAPAYSQFDPGSPMDDYYFSDWKLAVLDAVLKADLDLPLSEEQRVALLEEQKVRTQLDSGDLAPFLPEMQALTYRQLFASATALVARVRGSSGTVWAGMHENWTVETFPALARTFETSRFLVCLRDPRAVVASHVHVEPSIRAHILSFVRGIRKLHDLTLYFMGLPLFKGRLLVVTYEDLMRDPEATARRLCDFLGVEFEPEMLYPDRHFDRSTGGDWSGYSSFQAKVAGYDPQRIDRWRDKLRSELVELVELCLDPDMRFFGYMPVEDRLRTAPTGAALRELIDDNDGFKKWRTDSGRPEIEYGLELARREIIRGGMDVSDSRVLRRCFLMEELYRTLRDYPAHDGRETAMGGTWLAGEELEREDRPLGRRAQDSAQAGR